MTFAIIFHDNIIIYKYCQGNQLGHGHNWVTIYSSPKMRPENSIQFYVKTTCQNNIEKLGKIFVMVPNKLVVFINVLIFSKKNSERMVLTYVCCMEMGKVCHTCSLDDILWKIMKTRLELPVRFVKMWCWWKYMIRRLFSNRQRNILCCPGPAGIDNHSQLLDGSGDRWRFLWQRFVLKVQLWNSLRKF